jgi:hypothetical protein
MPETTFCLQPGGRRFPYFYHEFNCGLPDAPRRTERTVELPLADVWLQSHPGAWEIGAVTGNYWPGRCRTVIDPGRKTPPGTICKSMFAVSVAGQAVLSISTIEHVGERRYGLRERRTPLDALSKLAAESPAFLITVPVGYRTEMDEALFRGSLPPLIDVFYLRREPNEKWTPATAADAQLPYGQPWADAIAVLVRGDW